MNDLTELKDLIRLHVATQPVDTAEFLATVDCISDDGGAGPGSWVGEWSRLGERLLSRGALAAAIQAFNFARFPFVNGTHRRVAFERCLELFERFRLECCSTARRVELEHRGRVVPFYVSGTPGPESPLVIVMGGIVSLKEQWYRTLVDGPKLGFAVAVADFPGVGENELPFEPDSYQYLNALLDFFASAEREFRAIVVGISFSGHLALRQAARDRRIRGVIVSGTPLKYFFQSAEWLGQVPRTTLDTLAHVSKVAPDRLRNELSDYVCPESELARLTMPVSAVVSLRDEIIPPEDARYLERHVPHLTALHVDDVHGGPHYIGAIRRFIAYNLVRMGFPQRRVLAGVLWLLMCLALVRSRLALGWQRRRAARRTAVVPASPGKPPERVSL